MKHKSTTNLAPLLYCLLAYFLMVLPAVGQTKEKGPWWPNQLWGPSDQAGGSNWITPEKVLEVLSLVKTGKIYELGHIYEPDMPLLGQRIYKLVIPGSPTGGPVGKNGLITHDEIINANLGQVGTQFDGPGHIGRRLELKDGTTQDRFYNGYSLEEMASPYGLLKLGVEHVKPYITRGILIDIAAYKGVPTLPGDYEVSLADVRGSLVRQDMREEDIRPGDAIFFNYGWSKLWKEPEKYVENWAGIGMEVAQWIVERQASMIGSDGVGTEVLRNSDPDLTLPVHQELIMKHGIFNLENMTFEDLIHDKGYEFLFIFTPLRIKGATGSAARPLAIR